MRIALRQLIVQQEKELQQDRRGYCRPEVIIPHKVEDFELKCARLFHYAIKTLGFTNQELEKLPRRHETIKKYLANHFSSE